MRWIRKSKTDTLVLTLVVILCAAWLPTHAGKIYWSENSCGAAGCTGRIVRANLDGSDSEVVVTGGTFPNSRSFFGVALDLQSDKLYWSEDDENQFIRRSDLNGCAAEVVIYPTVPGFAQDLALDIAGSKIYWAGSLESTDGIYRVGMNGSQLEQPYSGFSPNGLALDLVNGKMYWTRGRQAGAGIRRANLDGSDVELLVDGEGYNDIAVDVAAGKIYWAQKAPGKIRRANLDGTNPEDVVTLPGSSDSALSLALDLSAGKVYWSVRDESVPFNNGRLERANLDGSGIELLLNQVTAEKLALDPLGEGQDPEDCLSPIAVPAMHTSGLLVLVLLLLAAGTVATVLRVRRP